MLLQELDYEQELKALSQIKVRLETEPRAIVPGAVERYSTKHVLAMTYEEGVAIDSEVVLALSQEERNNIAATALEILFKEMYEWGEVQSDPHFGNYRVRLDPIGKNHKLVLYDFGAVKQMDPAFLKAYRKLGAGAFRNNKKLVIEGGRELGFLSGTDSQELENVFFELCQLFVEPFVSETQNYDFGSSDLPMRVVQKAGELVLKFRFRAPPSQAIFVDRKLGGVFIFLSTLKANFNARGLLLSYLEKSGL